MKKSSKAYKCKICYFHYAKWVGKCAECGSWGSVELETEPQNSFSVSKGSKKSGKIIKLELLSAPEKQSKRKKTGIVEFDRVLGGGIVTSSAVLLSGEPGIGKSTLLLQVANSFSESGARVVYISGEEAVNQIRLRAERLDQKKSRILLASETNITDIIATIQTETADLLIIDSIQTLYHDEIPSAPGTTAQVRTCVLELTNFCKNFGVPIIFVGHVTKDGQIAGPKLVEHMVDTVVNFENDSGIDCRVLRTLKNRFGASNEIGVFEMTSTGLKEVKNPSQLFLSERSMGSNESVVFGALSGTRPILVEIQALIAVSSLATPRRTVVGLDSARLSMILAVLDARCGKKFNGLDVFVNVAGGIRIIEPAADLAIALSLISAIKEVEIPGNAVIFGEISLSGRLRPVTKPEVRVKEAMKLGFDTIVLPSSSSLADIENIKIVTFENIMDVIQFYQPTS